MRMVLICFTSVVVGCSSNRTDDGRTEARSAAAIRAAYEHAGGLAPWLIAGSGSLAGAREFEDHWRVDLPTRSVWGDLSVNVPKSPGEPPYAKVEFPLESRQDADLLKRIIELVEEARPPKLVPVVPVPAR